MRLWCCRAVFLPKALDKLLGYKKQILNQHMTAFARKLKKGHGWICQQDNDPKHTSRKKKKNSGLLSIAWRSQPLVMCSSTFLHNIEEDSELLVLFVCFMIIFQLFYFKGEIFLWIFWNNLKEQEDKHQRHFP